MKKTALKYTGIIVLTFCALYMLLFSYLPSDISIIKGNKVHIDSVLPVSISANIQTEGEIEYDFSSYDEGKYDATVSVAGIPVKKVKVSVLPDTLLVPCGNVEGLVLDYDGVMVLGTGKIDTPDGKSAAPSKGVLKTGDVIKEIEGVTIESRQQVSEIIEKSNGKEVLVAFERNGEKGEVKIKPAQSLSDSKYKIGCWIRGETQGLGTITYVNKNTGEFGALGHGVYDADAEKLLEIENGIVTKAEISGINKGEKGIPGEISGVLDKTEVIGKIEKNTACGVFGKMDSTDIFKFKEIPLAASGEIKEGKAVILSAALSKKAEEYDIEIESIVGKELDKSMMIKITDSRLIEKTGGIVQGMSGSPIIQEGKLVGAVTHVLVNDPTRGYGIFIENMLEAVG